MSKESYDYSQNESSSSYSVNSSDFTDEETFDFEEAYLETLEQIENLKKQVKKKDNEIKNLKKQVKNLTDKNTNLRKQVTINMNKFVFIF